MAPNIDPAIAETLDLEASAKIASHGGSRECLRRPEAPLVANVVSGLLTEIMTTIDFDFEGYLSRSCVLACSGLCYLSGGA